MESSSSETVLHMNSSLDAGRIFGAVEPPVSIVSHPAASISPACAGDAAADCRTVLVSRQRTFCDGLRNILQTSRISVTDEAHDISDLLSTIAKTVASDLIVWHVTSDLIPHPELHMVRDLRQRFAKAKLVVLVEAYTGPLLSSLVSAGVDAILQAKTPGRMLVQSLELVLCDLNLFPAEMLLMFVDHALGGISRDPAPVAEPAKLSGAKNIPMLPQIQQGFLNSSTSDPLPRISLSEREQQIVDRLARGLSNKHIARELEISEATVKVHVKSLLRKIRMNNRTQVAIWAMRQCTRAA
jgi:two-component system, NarL family, nitrate/nitrite response regulator NarL